jgi:hypothetical protein
MSSNAAAQLLKDPLGMATLIVQEGREELPTRILLIALVCLDGFECGGQRLEDVIGMVIDR